MSDEGPELNIGELNLNADADAAHLSTGLTPAEASSPKSTDELVQLTQLIQSSVATLERVCDESGVAFPSMNEPFTPESEAFRALDGAAQAADTIVAAAWQLIAAVMSPPASVLAVVSGMFQSASLRVCLEANVTEILREAGPEGMHIDEIAEKSGLNANKLGRLIRNLCVRHVYREVRPDVFANNRLSGVMDTGKSVEALKADPAARHDDTSGFPALMENQLDETAKAAVYLGDAMADPETGNSLEITKTAFNKAFNTDISIWQWWQTPEQALRWRRFGAAMRGVVALQPADQIYDAYEWEELPADSIVVDVAGGVGTSSLALAEKFNNLNIVLQDQPSVLEEAGKLWEAALPGALESGRVTFQQHDFFTEQPVKNATVFLLKQILHDWSKPYAVKILTQLREAAAPDTKLVIVDSILPYTCRVPEDDEAHMIPGAVPKDCPAPLTANYGLANCLAYSGDINMLVLFNAQERTLKELISVLNATGWKLVEVKQAKGAGNFKQSAIAVPV